MDEWSPQQVMEYLKSLLEAGDKRYEERFNAQQTSVKEALAAAEKAVNAALIASEKAILVAEVNSEKWRANANEWRSAMDDREAKFATQSEVDLQIRAMANRLGIVETTLATRAGKGEGLNFGWSLLLSVATFAVSLLVAISIFYKH